MVPDAARVALRCLVAVLFSMLLLPPLPCLAIGLGTQHLFRIERSTNANVVQYDAQLAADGKLYAKEPIVAYWTMLAEDGRKEDLSLLEAKLAYGFKTWSEAADQAVLVQLVAYPERKVRVYQANGSYHAEIVIAGHPAFLERIYVKSVNAAILPKVEYLELYGRATGTGANLYEKILIN
jgi:uncharacterized iron-regulated protein